MRVWFLTHRLPYAPNRGDRIRAYHILDWLHRRAEVHLLSLVHDADEAQAAADDVRPRRIGPHRAGAAAGEIASAASRRFRHGGR